jgi:hypothetical protein
MRELRTIRIGHGRTEVFGTVYAVGSDLLVLIGGRGLHIGAASLAEPGLGNGLALSGVTGQGHKEGELTDKVAQRLAAATGRRVLAVSGIHLDRITKAEIEEIRSNVERLSLQLVSSLAESPHNGS